MSKHTRIPALAAKPRVRIPSLVAISAKLESMMDACRPFHDADDVKDVQLALASLLVSCHDVLDGLAAIGGRASLEDLADAETAVRMDALMLELAGSLPPVRGGGADDFEVIDEAVYGDEWPTYPDPACDGYRWAPTFDGPTPLDVLEADEFEPERTDADWDAYAALSLGLSEEDHAITCGVI